MPEYRWDAVMKYLSGDVTESSDNELGGWSEGVYWSDASAATRASFKRLARARAGLLPAFSRVIGIRVTQVSPAGGSALEKVNYPGLGGAANASDTPWNGIALSVTGSGVANTSRRVLAAMPDGVLTRGEFKPDPLFFGRLMTYLNELGGWHFKGHDLTLPKIQIKTISEAGAVETNSDIALVVRDEVKLFKVQLANGDLLSGRYKVSAATDFRHFTLRNWADGAATLGEVQKWVTIFPTIVVPQPPVVKAARRPIGRPSGGYRARRSRRRVRRPTA